MAGKGNRWKMAKKSKNEEKCRKMKKKFFGKKGENWKKEYKKMDKNFPINKNLAGNLLW